MEEEATAPNMDESGSRRTSTSSRNSTRPDAGKLGPAGSSRPTQIPQRISISSRTNTVNMFTGVSDQPLSPSAPAADKEPSAMSPGSIDRVFPIRSAVSIDSRATPAPRLETSEGYPGLTLGASTTIASRGASGLRPPERQPVSPSTVSGSSGRQSSTSGPRASADAATAANRLSRRETRNSNEERRGSASTSTTGAVRAASTAVSSLLSDSASGKSSHASSTDGGVSVGQPPSSRGESSSDESGLLTARFKHVVTDGGHAVITGRDGETIQRCEDEPIHIPGAIQSFGLLVAFREEDSKLSIRVVSENSTRIIGYSPSQLFKLDNFLDIFSEEQADNLLDHLDFIRDDEAADVVANGPEVFLISLKPPGQRSRKLWCAMHVSDANRDLVVCEFEIEDDALYPLVPVDDGTPEAPEDTLNIAPTAEEFAESTANISKPLRILRSARKKRGEAAAMEVFNIMSQVQEQLASATTLPIFLKVLIGVIKELTGFHRVMTYQFDQAWNGRVVAELVDPRATKDLYKGLNFPASDIPKQARDLYKLNKVRLLYDRDLETARLVCRTVDELETPVDMTHAYLRAMSPIHIKYLANMAVRASMSISISAFGELWGLIACHAYGSKGMRVSFPIRKMCRLVGEMASRNIERLSYASRLQARKLINTASTAANPSGYIVASSDDLLKLFEADVGALSIRDETKVMGKSSGHMQEVLAMVEFLRLRKLTSVYTSQDIHRDFPDLRYAPGLRFLAGLLYVPLSNGGTDFIVFFRKGVLQEVKWAGNPYEKFVQEGTEGYLEPRKSFKTWSETIVGRCRDWSEQEIETASVLCLVYGKFIDVWRQKEAALENSQLTKLLLANSAHEVRTPLNAIINYLEIALEGSLDQDTRDNLAKSHSASKSLVYVINDLLDLTKTEGGKDLVKEEPFDLRATLQEATDPFSGDAKRKTISYTINIAADFPTRVIGDHRRVRQVVSNLVANAIQHTATGQVSVDAWCSAVQPSADRVDIEVAVEDTGAGMSPSQVESLFRELEEVSHDDVNDPAVRLLDQDPFVTPADGHNQAALGLGLAVVARTVRAMNGQLRLKSEEGKGSRFVIQMGFDLDVKGEDGQSLDWRTRPPLPPARSSPSTPVAQEGEVFLIERSAQKSTDRPSGMARKNSTESLNSFRSGRSQTSMASVRSGTSQWSDVDRLIDAIQEPILHDSGSVRRSLHAGEEGSPARPKARSVGSAQELKSSLARVPGQEKVADSNTPIKAVRLPDTDAEDQTRARTGNRVTFQATGIIEQPKSPELVSPHSIENFSILVAEDDPINSRIIKKRLEKLGHTVHLTVNGEECSSAHGDAAPRYDAVLMDLQMPIVDGFTSTKMIRSFEKTQSYACLSQRARLNGRIPIFAVSASLVESERERYIGTGFDGWILKPVDFKRVDLMLKGIVDYSTRESILYQPGKWEQGGWFTSREASTNVYDLDTRPNGERPAAQSTTSDDSDTRTVTPELQKASTL